MANIERMRGNLGAILRYEDQHDQGSWIEAPGPFPVRASNGEHPPCGTTMCFAGWDAFRNAPKGASIRGNYVCEPGWPDRGVWDFAREGMELTAGQSEAFFIAASTIGDLEALTDYIEDHPGASYEDLLAVISEPV
jgi:hypothetical protein